MVAEHALAPQPRNQRGAHSSRSVLRCRGTLPRVLGRGFDVAGIDRNADSVGTYTRNLGEASCTELDDETALPHADAIIAGPPCQPWSRAGKRLGQSDERDGLAIVARAVREIRPVAALIENVPDLARSRDRQHLDDFKEEIAALGYAVGEHLLNAADYGVPQTRRRVFVTAVVGDEPLDPPAPWSVKVTAREAIPGTFLSGSVGSTTALGRHERLHRAVRACLRLPQAP